jgi:peptidoglycan/LPS O-acetylase OafA/YrhL
MFVCCATALVLSGMIQSEATARQRLGWLERHSKLGRWLADRSYSLYLVHFTVIAGMGVLAAKAFHIHDRDAMGGKPLWFGVTLVGVIASFAIADLTYRFIESPSHRLARKLAAAA